MIRGFYTARGGLIAHQQHLDTIANNLANVNTVAFKPMRTSFHDLMYQNVNRAQAADTAMNGAGVKINKNDLLMGIGPMNTTDRLMDMALDGHEGDFFMLENPGGEVIYTRAGNFYLSIEDDTPYLVSGSGCYVLNADGERIELEVADTGEAIFDPAEVGVARFPNPYGLLANGDNAYLATPEAGEPEIVEEPQYQTAMLEGAKVEIANEMANIIIASKAFSLNSRMVQVADEVEQTINSLR